MNFLQDEIVFLLGAGASADAQIPTSIEMIQKIEARLVDEWGEFSTLYHYIRSAILYAEGIKGQTDAETIFNIEKLVDTLTQLEESEDHPIYPFIGNWNMKLTQVAGDNFQKLKLFKRRILEELKSQWVVLDDYRNASYLNRLLGFHHEYNFPLRVFTLNYDLCLEKNVDPSLPIQMGFDGNRTWNWRLFTEARNEEVVLFLYKLHGSVDWYRDDLGNLKWSESSINVDKLNIIFGTNYKLSYMDPFLFYIYEFRRFTLGSRLIVALGYGFGDEHINGIIKQALENDRNRKILCVIKTSTNSDEKRTEILKTLHFDNEDQVVVNTTTAQEYMEREMSVHSMGKLFPEEDEFPTQTVGTQNTQ